MQKQVQLSGKEMYRLGVRQYTYMVSNKKVGGELPENKKERK